MLTNSTWSLSVSRHRTRGYSRLGLRARGATPTRGASRGARGGIGGGLVPGPLSDSAALVRTTSLRESASDTRRCGPSTVYRESHVWTRLRRTVSAPINAAGGDVWRGDGGAQLPTGVPCCLASACVPPSVISSFDANNTPQGLVRDTPACWRGRVTHVRRQRGEARRSRGAALDTRSSVNAPL